MGTTPRKGGVAIERALCPVLVGRERELTLLEDALLAANRSEGQIVVLAGEAGVGKTRLASELQLRALKVGMGVLWGSCSEAELALPYLPFLEAIGNYLRGVDLDRLRQQLGPVRRELAHLFPQLETERAPRDSGDPTENKLRLFEAVLSLLNVPADAQALLFVLEDLQWADASTRELLDYLARRLRPNRIMVLATYRKDELHRKHALVPLVQGWRRAGIATAIDLQPLPPARLADMVQAIFDLPRVQEETRDFLYTRTEGNPFVLEEMLKAALDRGDILRTETGWTRKELSELKLPESVRDTILLRVERLSDEQAETLRTAAVLGPSFRYQTLVAVSGQDRGAVQAALRTFVQAQLMEEEPQVHGRYRFRHALTREAIYEDLIAPKREELHARAAEVLQQLPGTLAVDLAHHLLAAGQWEEAIPVCIKAAEEAEHGHGYYEAAELYGRALRHLTDKRARGLILCRLGHAYWLAGDPGKAQPYLEEGIPLLRQPGQERELAGYRLALGRCYWERSRPDLARKEYERARSGLEPLGPSEDLANACVRLAGMHAFELEFADALTMAERAVAVAEAANVDTPRIWAYTFIGVGLNGLGRVDEGLEYLDRSYQEAVERGLDWIAANALHNGIVGRLSDFRAEEALARVTLFRGLRAGTVWDLRAPQLQGLLYLHLGDFERARRALDESLALARQADASLLVRRSEIMLAACYGAVGRFEEALRLLPQGDVHHQRQDTLLLLSTTIRLLVDAGDVEGAVEKVKAVLESDEWGPLKPKRVLFDRAVEALLKTGKIEEADQLVGRTRTDGVEDHNPYQARMEGSLALARGDLAAALTHLSAAAEFLHKVRYRLEESRTRRLLAEAKAHQGDHAGAVAELRRGLAYADEYGAVLEGRWARQKLAELGVDIDTAGADEPPELKDADLRQASERLVTVLFVDVRGYTAMTVTAAPDEMAEKLMTFLRWARQEIERHHGLVDQYAGDALLATFNVSGVRLDHALHALQSAIAIRDKAGYAGLPVGIGIAVGPAIVGQLTTGANVTAVGETTNLAARLQAQAEAGEILLSAEAFRRVRSWIERQNLATREETLVLKGFPRPIAVHRLQAPVRTN